MTYRETLLNAGWGDAMVDMWDDLADDGKLTQRPVQTTAAPHAALAVTLTVPPKSHKEVTFLITWHYPHRLSWTYKQEPEDTIGNYYTTQYEDAWDVAVKTVGRLKHLEATTIQFVDSLCSSDLPQSVKEAALNNISTLRSQTVFRTPDGKMFGFEGCRDHYGSCHGSCTHVWNYEQTTAWLFGDLSRTMREVEFLHAMDDRGGMSFRVSLPLTRPHDGFSAADGQMGTIMRFYPRLATLRR